MNLYRSDGSLAGRVDVVTTYGNGKIKLTMENGGNFNFNKGEVVYHRAGDCWIMTKREQKPASKLTFASIKRVIFNPPATIVFWSDGTKTVVKCSKNEVFDPEKGVAMAIAKRAQGNCEDYYKDISKWCQTTPVKKPTDMEINPKEMAAVLDSMMEDCNQALECKNDRRAMISHLIALRIKIDALNDIFKYNK